MFQDWMGLPSQLKLLRSVVCVLSGLQLNQLRFQTLKPHTWSGTGRCVTTVFYEAMRETCIIYINMYIEIYIYIDLIFVFVLMLLHSIGM